MEIWKDVKGYEGLYLVSNYGNVMRTKNGQNKILQLSTFTSGYKCVGLRKGTEAKTVKVHRLVAIAFIPNPENKPHINHINCNTIDNTVENLEWCTHAENMAHAVRTGLKKGTKLTLHKIKTILILNDYGVDHAVIRLMVGMSMKKLLKVIDTYELRYHNSDNKQLKTAA